MSTTITVPVPVSVLSALVDTAERRADQHHHRTPNEWPNGVPCDNCTALYVVRPLVVAL